MKKILIEAFALLLTLFVAGVIVLFLFTQNVGQTTDTFTGIVSKVPIKITSPVYGQILTLSVKEGTTVTRGQTLVTIHILNANTLPTQSDLYHIHGLTLSIQSPDSGVIGQIALAPLSTIAGAGELMDLYTTSAMQIQILIPQGYDIGTYTAFTASNTPNGYAYPIQVTGQVPANVVSNIPITTTVYGASCRKVADCQHTLENDAIIVYGQKKQTQSPLLIRMRAWVDGLLHSL